MNKVDAAYLAGLIDGEGTVSLRKESIFRFPIICVASTSFELVFFCKNASEFGCISSKKLYKSHHKKSFHWTARHNDAILILQNVLPYMKEHEKVRRAKLILEKYLFLTRRNGKYSKEEIDKKIEFEKEFFKNSNKVKF